MPSSIYPSYLLLLLHKTICRWIFITVYRLINAYHIIMMTYAELYLPILSSPPLVQCSNTPGMFVLHFAWFIAYTQTCVSYFIPRYNIFRLYYNLHHLSDYVVFLLGKQTWPFIQGVINHGAVLWSEHKSQGQESELSRLT